jgi:hypothetical protein
VSAIAPKAVEHGAHKIGCGRARDRERGVVPREGLPACFSLDAAAELSVENLQLTARLGRFELRVQALHAGRGAGHHGGVVDQALEMRLAAASMAELA